MARNRSGSRTPWWHIENSRRGEVRETAYSLRDIQHKQEPVVRVKSFFKGLFNLGKFREETLADRRLLHDFIRKYEVKSSGNAGYEMREPEDEVNERSFANDFVYVEPALVPRDAKRLTVRHEPSANITKVGRPGRTKYGDGRTVSGIDVVRGFFISMTPILEVEIFLDSRLVYVGAPQVSALWNERTSRDIKKYAFNAWLDFTDEMRGKRELVVRAKPLDDNVIEGLTWIRTTIIVADPVPEEQCRNSDAAIPSLPSAPGLTLEQRINALPTSVHKASSKSIPTTAERILVLRIDQLGDLAVSVPALRRLREIVPNAHITALLGPANADLGRTLDLFDDIIVFDIPDDPQNRRRVAGPEIQIELGRLLHGRQFDVAINLAIHGEVNNLLHLSGAPVTVGFASGNTDWMTLSLAVATHEPKGGADLMRHSARTRTLVEAFGALLDSGAAPLRRTDLDQNVLNTYGIGNDDDFVVLHTGARIQFTRWHGYLGLAEKLLTETNLKIVIMADKPDEAISTFAEKHAGRVIAIVGKIPFDVFDALVSYCKVLVGNDSGPKHFAALRGTQVISIHSARIGWEEWGQEISGVVMSRKVPCAGCYLHYEPADCAKDVACIKYIQVDEVLREVKNCLAAT